MALYENEHRKQCRKCKEIKDKETDFGNRPAGNGLFAKANICNDCRQKSGLKNLNTKEENKKKKHWMENYDN